MNQHRHGWASDGARFPIAVLAMTLVVSACSLITPDGPDPGDVMDGPLDGLTDAEMAVFVRGDEQFEKAFSPEEGLGPVFNNRACADCHSGDGRGRPENILTRFDGLGGPQLQEKAIPGAEPERLPSGAPSSRRLPPPVFGVGLIEAIPEAAILANADPDDADGDGISGRPNWVTPPDFVPATEPGGAAGNGPGGKHLGRFSRKAQVSSLLQQTVGAYQQDIGITSEFLPVENFNPQTSHNLAAADRVPDPEIPAGDVLAVVAYIRTLAPPSQARITAERDLGKTIFSQIACANCHVPEFTTANSSISALANKKVPLYSDLLLHDMGDGLADYRADGDADGREWRTAPLWGMRVMSRFLNGEMFLLHDGRARSIEEAILLHGGEAQRPRDAFAALSAADMAALLAFVGGL